jgi:hypothetical protein
VDHRIALTQEVAVAEGIARNPQGPATCYDPQEPNGKEEGSPRWVLAVGSNAWPFGLPASSIWVNQQESIQK